MDAKLANVYLITPCGVFCARLTPIGAKIKVLRIKGKTIGKTIYPI